MNILDFLLNVFVKMTWISDSINKLFNMLGLDLNKRIVQSAHFFLYETVKIFMMIAVIIFAISFIQSYFPPKKTKELLTKYKGIKANIIAALLGVISPFCACSSIPIFIGINKAGAPLGASFSFLISSPLVDLASLFLLISLFGIKVGAIYTLMGIILAIIGGLVIESLNLQDEIILSKRKRIEIENKRRAKLLAKGKKIPESTGGCCSDDESVYDNRFKYSKNQTISVLSKIWKYMLVSILIGSIVYNYIPAKYIEKVLSSTNIFSPLIATLIGMPIYTDEMSSMVIGKAFYDKGASLGTVLSFMISAATLSLPSMLMLKSIMTTKLLLIFIGIVTGGVIFIGYVFNFLEFLI